MKRARIEWKQEASVWNEKQSEAVLIWDRRFDVVLLYLIELHSEDILLDSVE